MLVYAPGDIPEEVGVNQVKAVISSFENKRATRGEYKTKEITAHQLKNRNKKWRVTSCCWAEIYIQKKYDQLSTKHCQM